MQTTKTVLFIDRFKENLFGTLEYYHNLLKQSGLEDGLGTAVKSSEFLKGLVIWLFMSLITFAGRKYEQTSLSLFVGIFFYTLAVHFIGTITQITPWLLQHLPEFITNNLPKYISKNVYWLTLIVTILGLIFFFMFYRILKIASILIFCYLSYDYIGKNYLKMPETLDYTNKLLVCALVLTFYIIISYLFSLLFSIPYLMCKL